MNGRQESAIENDELRAAIEGHESPTRAVEKIAEAAMKDMAALLSAEGWLVGLRELPEVACEFYMEDMLTESYLWWDGEAYRATGLGLGLEDRENRPLSRHEAAALIDAPLRKPIHISEVDK